jgi:Flp pilus assembly protein TadD
MSDAIFTKTYMALFYDEESEYLAVVATLSHHLIDHPENWRAWNNRGVARHEIGELDEARADLDQAVERSDWDAVVIHNRALLRMDADDPAGAIADYSAAIRQASADASLFRGRADAYAALGDTKAAELDRAQAEALSTSISATSPHDIAPR